MLLQDFKLSALVINNRIFLIISRMKSAQEQTAREARETTRRCQRSLPWDQSSPGTSTGTLRSASSAATGSSSAGASGGTTSSRSSTFGTTWTSSASFSTASASTTAEPYVPSFGIQLNLNLHTPLFTYYQFTYFFF